MMQGKTTTRQHILDTAAGLFFPQGYRAVGIDTIIAQSGVAKMTLYRHFPSKDDLIVAYLEDMNAKFWVWFEAAAGGEGIPARQQVINVFTALEKLVTSPQCYGCPFLNAASEFPEQGHPGHRVALEHKRRLQARLRALALSAGAVDADRVGDHLLLLMDGAFMAVRMYGVDNPAVGVAGAAARLLELANEM